MQAFAEPQPTHDVARDEAFEELYRSYARDVYRSDRIRVSVRMVAAEPGTLRSVVPTD